MGNNPSHGTAPELDNGGPSKEAMNVAQSLSMTALRPMSLDDHGIEVIAQFCAGLSGLILFVN
jgi:hypothetical protein